MGMDMGMRMRRGFLALNNNSPVVGGVNGSGRVVEKDGDRQMLELASFTSFGGPVSSVPSTSSGSTPVKQQQPSGTDPSAFVSTLSLFLLIQTLPFPPPPPPPF